VKKVEEWQKRLTRSFGKLADTPMTERVMDFLLGGAARTTVLACISIGVPLEGVSDEKPGVPAARQLWLELEKLKNLPAAGSEAAAGASAAGASGSAAADADLGAGAPRSDGALHVDIAGEGGTEFDPARLTAERKAEGHVASVTFYTPDQLEHLHRAILPAQKVAIFIDAPTSKTRIINELIGKASKITRKLDEMNGDNANVSVRVNVGRRLDVLSSIDAAMRGAFPSYNCFSLLLTFGPKQTVMQKPRYLFVAISTAAMPRSKSVPTSIPAMGSRARKHECINLRCLSQDCPLRTDEEKSCLVKLLAEGKQKGLELERSELPVDDRADIGVDEHNQEGDDNESSSDGEALVAPPEEKKKCLCDLWAFSFAEDFYKQTSQTVHDVPPAHAIQLTTSAHPSFILAALADGSRVHVYLDRVSQHSRAHGLALLKRNLQKKFYAEERGKELALGVKRLRSDELYFIDVEAPEPDEQLIRFDEAVADPASSWRSGVDQYPAPSEMKRLVLSLLQRELDVANMTVEAMYGGDALVAHQFLKEGSVALPHSTLTFTSRQGVQQMLSDGCYGALLEGASLWKVGGILTTEDVAKELYLVAVGAGRFIIDYRKAGRKKRPNVVLKIDPSKGPNDGLATWVVRTPNACGIAAKRVLLADLGTCYVENTAYLGNGAEGASPAKKMKDAMEMLFSQTRQNKEAEDAESTVEVAPDEAASSSKRPKLETVATGGGGATGGAATLSKGGAAATPPGAAATAKAGAAVTAKAGAAATVKAGAAATTAGVEAGSAADAASGKDGTTLHKANGIVVTLNAANNICMVAEGVTNKQLAPKSILAEFNTGKCGQTEQPHLVLACRFEDKKELVLEVKKSGQSTTKTFKTLEEFVKDNKVISLYNHVPFTVAGKVTQLALKSEKYGYVPREDEMWPARVKKAVVGSQVLKLVWAVEAVEGKAVPVSVVLATTKQQIATPVVTKFP